MRSYGIYSKVILNSLVCDRFIPRLIRLVVFIIWTKAELLSIMLWLIFDRAKLFCGLTLNYNLVVCGTPNLIKLCYSSTYKGGEYIRSSIGVYGMVCL